MSKKEKPLPEPSKTAFGRMRHFEKNEENEPLISDQMAKAMAEGKLDEFLQNEIPDNEHARKLTMMMMSMTGLMPPDSPQSESKTDKVKLDRNPETTSAEEPFSPNRPPGDVINAVQSGDVKGLMGLLYREHQKRIKPEDSNIPKEKKHTGYPDSPIFDNKVINQLIKIASENNVSQDWLMMRALKLYLEEYQKTGRL
jgi:hypothetical protein